MRTLFCLALIFGVMNANAADTGAESEANAASAAFEKQLNSVADENERVRLAQAYFAGLKTSAEKIAALGLLDSRYVYVIPKQAYAEILTRLSGDAELAVRVRAARAMGYNGLSSKFQKELLALLNERDVEIQKTALFAMGSGGDEFLVPIKTHLRSADAEIRSEAALAYAHWLASEQRSYLELLKSDDPNVRGQAAEMALRASHASALSDVLRLLGDPNEDVRSRTVRALGGVDAASGAVAAKLSDVPPVRAAAVESLSNMQDRQNYVATIGALLDDADETVRLSVIRALGELRAEQYTPQLTELREHATGLIQLRAREALDLMARARAAAPSSSAGSSQK